MMPSKRKESSPSLHHCPACQQPQTKIQRRVGETARGSTIYVCARKGECIVGVDLAKVEGWVAV